MPHFPNLVSVTCIKGQPNVVLESERTATDRVGGVSDSERLMKIMSSLLRYVPYNVSCSWHMPLVWSPVFSGVGQFGRSIGASMFASFPIACTSVRSIVIVGILSICHPPVWAGIKLTVGLQNMAFRNVRPLVIVRDNRATPNLPCRAGVIVSIRVIVFLYLLCAATLPLRPVHGQDAVMKLVVTHDKPRALKSINECFAPAVFKYIIFNKDEFLGTPIWVVGPRAVTKISPVPCLVVNVDRVVVCKVELTMIYDTPKKPTRYNVRSMQLVERAMVYPK